MKKALIPPPLPLSDPLSPLRVSNIHKSASTEHSVHFYFFWLYNMQSNLHSFSWLIDSWALPYSLNLYCTSGNEIVLLKICMYVYFPHLPPPIKLSGICNKLLETLRFCEQRYSLHWYNNPTIVCRFWCTIT